MSQLSFNYDELVFMIEKGHVSDLQIEKIKRTIGENVFYIKFKDGLSLINTWSYEKFAPEHQEFAELKLSELGLKPGESAGAIGRASKYIYPVLHLTLPEKDRWCFRFMMPESLRKKYIERGYQFSEFVVNREAQIKLNFWSNPWGEDPEGRSMYREWKRQNHIQDSA